MRFLVGLAFVCLAFLYFLKTEKPSLSLEERQNLPLPVFEKPLQNSLRLDSYDPLAALFRTGAAWTYLHKSHEPVFRVLANWFWPLLAGRDPLIWEWEGQHFRLLAPWRSASSLLKRFSSEQRAMLKAGQILSLSYGESSPIFCSREQKEWLFCHNSSDRPELQVAPKDSIRSDLKLELRQMGVQAQRAQEGLNLTYFRKDQMALKSASLFSCEQESFCLQMHLPEAFDEFLLKAYEGPLRKQLVSALGALNGDAYLWGSYQDPSLKWLELGLEAYSLGESARLMSEWLGILRQEKIPFEVMDGRVVFSFPILPHKLELKREQEKLKIRLGPVARIQEGVDSGLGSLVLSIQDFRDLLLKRLKAFRFQKQKELKRECESKRGQGALGSCPLGPGYFVAEGQVHCPLHQNPVRSQEIGDALFSHAEFFLNEISWVKLVLSPFGPELIQGAFRIR